MYDVNFVGQNAHFCMDWSARVEMAPLILLHFDCAQFGSNGVALLKPGQSAQAPDGLYPSALQPGVGGGGGGGGGIVGGSGIDNNNNNPGIVTSGGGGGAAVAPVSPINPVIESTGSNPPTIENGGPDENGNLPQVAAGDGDFDPVDDLKFKQTTAKYNYNFNNNVNNYGPVSFK